MDSFRRESEQKFNPYYTPSVSGPVSTSIPSPYYSFDFASNNNMYPSAVPSPTELDSQNLNTPNSLGWEDYTEIHKSYRFRVPKGQKPYFELLPGITASSVAPLRVYLDKPDNPKMKTHPCQFPGCGPGKQNVFNRPADLERHYKNVHMHTNHKDNYHCDYPKCPRFKEPFTRKDHFRDHLRDFHKEDVGSVKLTGKVAKNTPEFEKMHEHWLAERQIKSRHWRCAKCLVKVDVRRDGWDCPQCKSSCEEGRITARKLLASEEEESRRDEAMEPAQQQNNHSSYSDSATCFACHGGFIQDAHGVWQPCNHPQDSEKYPSSEDWESFGYD